MASISGNLGYYICTRQGKTCPSSYPMQQLVLWYAFLYDTSHLPC